MKLPISTSNIYPFDNKGLFLPLINHIYGTENANMFRNAVLYSNMLWNYECNKHPEFTDEYTIMDYIDNHQFHWLLALGEPLKEKDFTPNDNTIEYCREEAEKFAIELDKRQDNFLSNVITEDELPF